MAALLLLSVGGALALADPSEDPAASFLPSDINSAQDMAALTEYSQPVDTAVDTDPAVAHELPHSDLDRGEAEDLLAGVFGLDELEAPAEFFNELDVRAFHSDHVAVVDPPQPGADPGLLVSDLPLRAPDHSGESAPVDLSLEETAGGLEPANPLVPVEIPDQLSEGISLPEADISVDVASGSVDRGASELGDASAFYPNVATDTDFVVAAAPTGFETFTHLRSADAPTQQRLDLNMPTGAHLRTTAEGGAEVVLSDGSIGLSVSAPSAIDAAGADVPVSIAVEGNAVILSAQPQEDAVYPILLDPIFDIYNFTSSTSQGTQGKPWVSTPNIQGFGTSWGSPKNGMNARAWVGPTAPGNNAWYNVYVPRYWTDIQAGLPQPSSYIRQLNLWYVTFAMPDEQGLANQYRSAYPSFQTGLWATNKFAAYGEQFGYEGEATKSVYELKNPTENTNVKNGGFGIATWASYNTVNRYVNVQQASVELTDQDSPVFESIGAPSGWMNSTATGAIPYVAADLGLGIYTLKVRQPSAEGGTQEISTSNGGCVGTAQTPCPIKAEAATRAITYSPQSMAQGDNAIEVLATDPVGHVSSAVITKVKVDHSAPSLALSGNLTEQATVGTNLSSYTLNYGATDGDDAAAAAIAPSGSAGKGPGQLERPMGVAMAQDGSVYTVDRVNNRVLKYDKEGKLVLEFGSTGSGDGQFNDPRGIDIAPDGTVWVADMGNDRVQAFSPTGVFQRKAKFTDPASEPYAIASGPGGVIWVTDIGLHRVIKLSENPITTLLITTGIEGTGHNVSGIAVISPTGIATDKFGNVWIADGGLGKVLELDSAGKPLFQFGTGGPGDGQIDGIVGIDVSPAGNIGITERNNGRVQIFKPDGSYLRKFGSAGSANGQFFEAGGLSFGPNNALAVATCCIHHVASWEHADQSPQSGAAKLQVKVDGVAAVTKEPGCTTKNCGISGSWTLNADSYSGGAHKVEVTATDAVGLQSTKTLEIQTHGDHTDPTVALSGTMTQQASLGTTRPRYKLKAVTTDPGPTEERKSGVASATIKVDGTLVDSSAPGCPAGGCSIIRDWTLNSNSYSVGAHTVEVKATDASGRITTKTLTINIARDTTAPVFAELSPFYTKPSGWLEQRSYFYYAAVTDANGYGVTSVELKIDGSTVNSTTGECPEGNCLKLFALEDTLDMSSYSGGAHPAELLATDGAGNTRKRSWTINVDPSGVISVSEAKDTIEALESTTGESPLNPENEENQYEGAVPGLTLVEAENGYQVSGSAVPTAIGSNADSGNQLQVLPEGALAGACEEETNSPEEEAQRNEGVFDEEELEPTVSQCAEEGEDELGLQELQVTPVGTSANATTNHLVNSTATVAANTAQHVDTVTRPIYEGAMTFKDIRDVSAPGIFYWHVGVNSDQELKQVNDQQAIVYWKEGGPAFSIKAIAAHDAVGTSVQTSIEVIGPDSIALTVHHKDEQFVYPVVAGVGWQGGFTTYQVVMHDPTGEETVEESEEPGSVEGVGGSGIKVFVRMRSEGPPVAYSGNGCDDVGPDMQWCHFTSGKQYNFKECYYEGPDAVVPEPPPTRAQLVNDAIEHCKSKYGWRRLEAKLAVHGWYRTNTLIDQVWIEKGNLHCDKWGNSQPAKVDCEKRPQDWERGVGQPGHIEVLGDYRFWPGTGPGFVQPPGGAGTSECVTGWGEIEFGHGTESQETIVSPARQGDPCNWP